MICSLNSLDPPRIAGEGKQHRWMLPELLQFVEKRVLYLVERREHAIGEVLAHVPEDLLSRIQFRTIRRQIKRVHANWPLDLTAAMTARTIQHHPDGTLAQFVAHMPQEDLEALAFHGRYQQKDTRAGGGFHHRK